VISESQQDQSSIYSAFVRDDDSVSNTSAMQLFDVDDVNCVRSLDLESLSVSIPDKSEEQKTLDLQWDTVLQEVSDGSKLKTDYKVFITRPG
jgi:hypothetical protein